MTERQIMNAIAWKQQAINDCAEWASVTAGHGRRLEDFKAGVAAGWDACLNTLKIQDMIKGE